MRRLVLTMIVELLNRLNFKRRFLSMNIFHKFTFFDGSVPTENFSNFRFFNVTFEIANEQSSCWFMLNIGFITMRWIFGRLVGSWFRRRTWTRMGRWTETRFWRRSRFRWCSTTWTITWRWWRFRRWFTFFAAWLFANVFEKIRW